MRKGANRLAGEVSPYLLQHAHNPVDWMPWGDEVWERAKKEGEASFSKYWVFDVSLVPSDGEGVVRK